MVSHLIECSSREEESMKRILVFSTIVAEKLVCGVEKTWFNNHDVDGKV